MIRDAEESRSGQLATRHPHVLHLCCQGVAHAFNLDQSQVKSHGGLTCVRACGFYKLVFSTRSIEYSLVRTCFRQGPLFFSASSSIHRSVCVLSRSIVSSTSLSIHQPCVLLTSSIVLPGLCSVQSAGFSGKFRSVDFSS